MGVKKVKNRDKSGRFIKGHNINKGKKLSKEHRKKLSENHWSKKPGFIHPFKGKHHSDETKRKISRAHKGKKLSSKQCEQIGDRCSGSKNWQWKGGKRGYHRKIAHNVIKDKTGIIVKHPICVHHINGDWKDNRPENLLVCTKGYHVGLHNKLRWLK